MTGYLCDECGAEVLDDQQDGAFYMNGSADCECFDFVLCAKCIPPNLNSKYQKEMKEKRERDRALTEKWKNESVEPSASDLYLEKHFRNQYLIARRK